MGARCCAGRRFGAEAQETLDVISAAFNVEFHFDAVGPRVGNEGRGNDLAYAELFSGFNFGGWLFRHRNIWQRPQIPTGQR